MITPEFICKLFQEPQFNEYQFSDLNKMQSSVEWISHKEDSKNIQQDKENLISDMNISVSEYKSKNNG
ncbi:MAG: hypothetical protein KF732_11745 [Flavobacteriales bacterium]|nr:hypothetical protein [Flavobacteriales bacterium]